VTHLQLGNSESLIDAISSKMEKFSFEFLIIDSRSCIIDARIPALFSHLHEARTLNLICKDRNVVPICIVTDPLMPGFALVVDLVTYRSGLVAPITAPIPFSKFLLRKSTETLGTPISIETFFEIEKRVNEVPKLFDLFLGGSNYEPRKSYFKAVLQNLDEFDLKIQLQPKMTDTYIDYLQGLSSARMVLSTNFLQLPGSKKLHLLGKSLEALHVGSLLLTQSTPELRQNFVEYEDFVPVTNATDASEKILFFHQNEKERNRIARNGYAKARLMANSRYFFREINRSLRNNKLPTIYEDHINVS
jgi:glycosyltransferase involved in cell wall biosynthesis